MRRAAASAIHPRETKASGISRIFHQKMLEIQARLGQAARPLWDETNYFFAAQFFSRRRFSQQMPSPATRTSICRRWTRCHFLAAA
jgi:hypothetical protein